MGLGQSSPSIGGALFEVSRQIARPTMVMVNEFNEKLFVAQIAPKLDIISS